MYLSVLHLRIFVHSSSSFQRRRSKMQGLQWKCFIIIIVTWINVQPTPINDNNTAIGENGSANMQLEKKVVEGSEIVAEKNAKVHVFV